MTSAIMVNTLVLAFDQYPISYAFQGTLEFVNSLLSYIFIVEMVIKLIGLGISEYCGDNFNIFDGSVVIISIIEMIISGFIEGDLGGGAIRVHDVHPLSAPLGDSGDSPAAPLAVIPHRLPPTVQRLAVGQPHPTSSMYSSGTSNSSTRPEDVRQDATSKQGGLPRDI